MVDLVDLEIKLRKSSLSGHPKDPIPTVVRVRVEASDDVSNHEDETSSTTEAPQVHKKENGQSQVPMCAALFVATALGTPAIAFTGLKLGMAAALGGGMMGFFTGKIFAKNEEKEAIARGDYADEDGRIPSHIKKKKILERIHEWERFEANCKAVREMDKEQVLKISELHRQNQAESLESLSRISRSTRSNRSLV